jgi:hypothetical protein
MLVEIPMRIGDDHYQTGTWHRFLAHTPEPEYRPFWSAMITCPECGKFLNAINHTISADGQISPSLGHPVEYPPCGWHTNPKLIGWEQWPVPPIPNPETCEKCGFVAHTIGGWGTWNGGTGLLCAKCHKEWMGMI